MMKDISILIVTHNHSKYLESLINSLIKFEYKNVFFCDAASTDKTPEILMSSPFKKNVLLKQELEGFSKNNNDLIRHFELKSQYYLLLNPDTYFTEDFLKVLYEQIQENPKIGIVAPLLKYPNGDIQVTWKKFPSVINVFKKRLGLLKATEEVQMKGPEIDWCLGACMLIDNSFLKSKGVLLDERYRLYCEDIDICFEAKVKEKKVVGVRETFIYHHLNETSARNIFSKYNRWNINSIFKFIAKWNFKFFFR